MKRKNKIKSIKKNIEQLKEEKKISAQVAKKRRLKEKRLNEVVNRVRAEVDLLEKLVNDPEYLNNLTKEEIKKIYDRYNQAST